MQPVFTAWKVMTHFIYDLDEKTRNVSGQDDMDTRGKSRMSGPVIFTGRMWRRNVMNNWRPKTMMKRFFQRWLRYILGDWQVTTALKCEQAMIVYTTLRRDKWLSVMLLRLIVMRWKRTVWLEVCQKSMELDREDMRKRYSMRRWGRHEESLSPEAKKAVVESIRSPKDRIKTRAIPAVWLPEPAALRVEADD